MNRRDFLVNVLSGSLVFTGMSAQSGKESYEKITILHTNDTHSHIDAFSKNHSRYGGMGGVNRRKLVVDKIRSEEKHVLLLDAGDIFQGTPYFNLYGGELELKVMSALKYDAATMGNHDFDAGLEGFNAVLPNAKFPFLCANYDFSDTVLNRKTMPFKIFRKGRLKIGVFGIGVALEGLVSKAMYGNTRYEDPVKKAQYYADILKKDHECDLVICLSHLGYKHRSQIGDIDLALKTSNIDLIIGGHTHTLLKRPEIHQNALGKNVIINQVGWAGLYLGRVDFYFSRSKGPELWSSDLTPSNVILSV